MINVEDIIDRPHEPLRCLGYVLLVLTKHFKDFDAGEIPSTDVQAKAWLASPPDSHWREIGTNVYAATRDGDVLYCEPKEGLGHVAVLVDPARGGFLTSTPDRGSCVLSRRHMKGVMSVQRRDR